MALTRGGDTEGGGCVSDEGAGDGADGGDGVMGARPASATGEIPPARGLDAGPREASVNPYRIEPDSPWHHAANVSGGRSSGYMLRKLLDAHGGELPPRCEAVFANTGRERPETLDFVAAMSDRWGVPITWLEFAYVPDGTPKTRAVVVDRESAATDGAPFEAMLRSVNYLPSVTARICTSELKVLTIDRYLWHSRGLTKRQTRKLVGFRFDEPARWRPAVYEQCEIGYPMVAAGVTKRDVAEFWQAQPFDLGIPSERGNCDLCYLKGRPNLLATIRDEPWRADWWIEAERRRGRTFRIGESFEALKAAALAGESGAGDVAGGQADLPCFCTD